MKTTKSIIAIFLALFMLFSTFTFTASAEAPKITNIKWNNDYSVDFSFEGAAKYTWNVYVNGSMVWGFGTTSDTKISREKMLPYLTVLAQEVIDKNGYSGNVSFDFVIYAKNSSGNNISSQTIVSKIAKVEDVAAGKIAPDSETWQYSPVNTTDESKLRAAIYGAYDPDQAKIQSLLSSSGITYHQYINGIIDNARKNTYYTFTGTLLQAMRFGSFYSSYAYTNVTLAPKDKIIKEVNITIAQPNHGVKAEAYLNGNNIICETPGVTVTPYFESQKVFEVTTKTYQKKFYVGNKYQISYVISYNKGYSSAGNVIVKVNGVEADYTESTIGNYDGTNGYLGYAEMIATGNFFQRIATFFHNIFTR